MAKITITIEDAPEAGSRVVSVDVHGEPFFAIQSDQVAGLTAAQALAMGLFQSITQLQRAPVGCVSVAVTAAGREN